MAARRINETPSDPPKRRRPAASPKARENQIVSKAIDLAEKQIESGEVSAQVLTHYLKLASSREKLEQERLALENKLAEAKIEALASAKRVEELYESALTAMRSYSGTPVEEDFEED